MLFSNHNGSLLRQQPRAATRLKHMRQQLDTQQAQGRQNSYRITLLGIPCLGCSQRLHCKGLQVYIGDTMQERHV